MRNVRELSAWAQARLEGRAAEAPELPTVAELAKRLGLDALERSIVLLLYAAERSLEAARAARAASGKPSLTVEAAREALGEGVDAALLPGARLRRHAIVAVEGEGFVSASAELSLAVGVAARLDGSHRADGIAPGVRLIGPLVDGTEWVQRLPPSARAAELVKEELAAADAELFTVDGCPAREALGLAVALARRLK